ncbi:DEAD/DEAH box helicase [Candidatus Microgenomates bacterium]|nr:MAG: DEAD/DEAH box helicase [Candidatus Microgenomates bacterium]
MFRQSHRKFQQRPHNRFRPKSQNFRHGSRGNATPSLHPSAYIRQPAPQQVTPQESITHQFADFAVDEQILRNIATRGFTIPTPIQDKAIPHILDGRDVVGIANTGTGKTGAFLIPLINKIMHDNSQKALIVVPTRELAVQIRDELQAFAAGIHIRSVLCIGGTNLARQITAVKQEPNIIIGTPGRLKDLINRHALRLTTFQHVILDEVDRMVDIGFIKDIRFIISFLSHERQSLFFSATITPEINNIMQTFLQDPVTVSVKVNETANGIAQDVIRVKTKEEKVAKLQELLRQQEFTKVLIFGRTKWNVERLVKSLQQNGFLAASIHSNKSQNQRLRVLSQFKQDQLKILVATDIAARGLDIEDVSHVINFDEPSSYTDYVHRIGRTGRANKQGKALTFVM